MEPKNGNVAEPHANSKNNNTNNNANTNTNNNSQNPVPTPTSTGSPNQGKYKLMTDADFDEFIQIFDNPTKDWEEVYNKKDLIVWKREVCVRVCVSVSVSFFHSQIFDPQNRNI
jgi:hypothetical protein